MDPLVFLAKRCLNKAGRDLVAGYLADRDESRRTDNAENRFHFNQLTVRISRLERAQRLVEFSAIGAIGIRGALRAIAAMGATGAVGENAIGAIDGSTGGSDRYEMALCRLDHKIPSKERPRFERDGDIYGIVESIFWGKKLKSSVEDRSSLRGAFVLTEDLSSVKEVMVYGRLNGSDYPHEIIKFLINKSGHYEFSAGLYARFHWMKGF